MISARDDGQADGFALQPELLTLNFKKYLRLSGLFYKFAEGELFEDINLDATIARIIRENNTEASFLELAETIQAWNGEFNMLFAAEEMAFEALLNKMNLPKVSQSIIIKKMQDRAALDEEKIAITDSGKCAGLTFTSGLGVLLTKAGHDATEELTASGVDVPRLIGFERMLARVATTDVKSENPELGHDYAVLFKTALPLQHNQLDEHKAINDVVGKPVVAPTELKLSWVFNQRTLPHIFGLLLAVPGKLIKFGASKHAAHAYTDTHGRIHYYNPNTTYGYLIFDNVPQFLNVLAQGFDLADVRRFPLTVSLFDLTTHTRPGPNLEALISELIELDFVVAKREDKASTPDKILRSEIINRQAANGMTALNQACFYNNNAEAEMLIRLGANPNPRTIEKESPLYFSMIRSNVPLAATLLRSGARIDEEDRDGLTPLHRVAGEEKLGALADIILANPDLRINAVTKAPNTKPGWTALHIASATANIPVVEKILEHKESRLDIKAASSKLTPLQQAATTGNEALIRLYVRYLARKLHDINTLSDEKADATFVKGKTALCYTVEDLDEVEEEQRTAQLNCALILLEAGADISFLPMNLRWIVLMHGVSQDSGKYLPLLSRMLAEGTLVIDPADASSIDALTTAIHTDNVALLRVLVEHEPLLLRTTIERTTEPAPDAEEEETYHFSILHYAVCCDAEESMNYLLGRDPGLRTQKDTLFEATAEEWIEHASDKKVAARAIFAKHALTASPTHATTVLEEKTTAVVEATRSDSLIVEPREATAYVAAVQSQLLLFSPRPYKRDDYECIEANDGPRRSIPEANRSESNACTRIMRSIFGISI